MNLKDTRWRQRFENLLKAYALFESGATAAGLNRLEQEGLIQRFEYTFELSWKTLKDYLEAKGLALSFPRDVIKEAFKAGTITDGEVWMEMLEDRNRLSHTYEETAFAKCVAAVRERYFPAIRLLVERLRIERDGE